MKTTTLLLNISRSLATATHNRTHRRLEESDFCHGWDTGVCFELVWHLRQALRSSSPAVRRQIGQAIRSHLATLRTARHQLAA